MVSRVVYVALDVQGMVTSRNFVRPKNLMKEHQIWTQTGALRVILRVTMVTNVSIVEN